jgi:hypothetical protein
MPINAVPVQLTALTYYTSGWKAPSGTVSAMRAKISSRFRTYESLFRGRRRQVVKAPDCGSGIRGFESPRLPILSCNCHRFGVSGILDKPSPEFSPGLIVCRIA